MTVQQEPLADDQPLGEADLLEEMVMALVDHPAKVKVDSSVRGRTTELVVHTDPRDCGKVIGKSGRTVEAIRTYLGMVASKDGRQVTVRMADEVGRERYERRRR